MNWRNLIIPGSIVLILIAWSFYTRGMSGVVQGFREGGSMLWGVWPNLIIGFTLAGFILVLVPQDLVAQWLGKDSGTKGLFIGSAAGMLTPGGPFTQFPILASLITKGAAIGPVTAYVSAWALIGISRILIWEAPIMGWKFVGIRVLGSMFFPVVIGFACQQLDKFFRASA